MSEGGLTDGHNIQTSSDLSLCSVIHSYNDTGEKIPPLLTLTKRHLLMNYLI